MSNNSFESENQMDSNWCYTNAREHRRSKQEWTIQKNWQHRTHKTKKNKAKTQHNMCWTPPYASKHK